MVHVSKPDGHLKVLTSDEIAVTEFLICLKAAGRPLRVIDEDGHVVGSASVKLPAQVEKEVELERKKLVQGGGCGC